MPEIWTDDSGSNTTCQENIHKNSSLVYPEAIEDVDIGQYKTISQKQDKCRHTILTSKPNSGEKHMRKQRISAHKTISKQTLKEEINKRDKDVRADA